MTKFEENFLCAGLNPRKCSNKYSKAERVSEDETKIVVRISNKQVFPTKYGYGLIVGQNHVVWLKSWQVVENWYTDGNYDIVLDKQYYNVKESNKPFEDITVGDCASDTDFEKENGYHSWDDMVMTAKAQQENKLMFLF